MKDRLKVYNELGDYQKQAIVPFPKNMLLEVTNCCNHSCLFCSHSKGERQLKIINEKLAKRVLNDAYMLGTREVGFYGTGEPLLDMNLEKYIEYAKSLEYIYITTNDSLFTESRIKSVIDAGIDSIKFSINAGTEKSYEIIHGKNDFLKVIDNIKKMSAYITKSKKDVELYVSFVATRYTENEVEILKEKIGSYIDDIFLFPCKNQGGQMLEINEYLSIKNCTANSCDGMCVHVFKDLYVTCEGFISMCCSDFQRYLAVADLNAEKLFDAWNNQYAQKLREMHLHGDYKGTMCYNCVNNCYTDIKPLKLELATECIDKEWTKRDEIMRRISLF